MSEQLVNQESQSQVKRVSLILAYNGSAYYGWQSQKSGIPTIQKLLEEALSKVANEPIEITCAGRTDKSVHASHQVIHFDTRSKRTARAWVFGCNTHLPKDISVLWAADVDPSFHARFSALSRRYHYVIFNHPIRPASFGNELTWHHHPLNADFMDEASQCLVGEHDFSSFRAAECQSKSPFRFIEFISVKRIGDIILIDIKGNAFLHHMVRNIAGVLLAIGGGKAPVSWCAEVLEAKDRTKAAATAPATGLYLTHVDYPSEFNIPQSTGAPSLIQSMLYSSNHASSINQDIWKLAYLE